MYSSSHTNRGIDYHTKFKDEFIRFINWKLEKQIISKTIQGYQTILDVATGTGRVSCFVKQKYPLTTVTGIDISASMLAVAKSCQLDVRFIEDDFITSKKLDNKFDVITAFRFLPNADISLLKNSIARISNLIQDDGVVLINNHRSLDSLANRIKRTLHKKGGKVGCSDQLIINEFTKNGLVLKKHYSISLFPFGYEPFSFFKYPVYLIELINYKVFSKMHCLGQNNIMVFEKNND